MNTNQLTDTELLRLFRLGEKEANGALQICYQKSYQKIFTTLMKIKANEVLVEEAVQDGFISVFERLKGAEETFTLSSSLEAYFMTSCKRKYIKSLKDKHLSFKSFENIPELANLTFIEFDISAERADCLFKKVIPTMGKTCKKILSKAYLGWKNEAIAIDLGVKENYITRKKSECIAAARELVQQKCLN